MKSLLQAYSVHILTILSAALVAWFITSIKRATIKEVDTIKIDIKDMNKTNSEAHKEIWKEHHKLNEKVIRLEERKP